MLFKRFFEGKPMLNETKSKAEKCSRRKSECDGCGEHSTILEEMMKMVMLGVVLWAGVTFGSHITPYPLNLLITTELNHPPPMYDFPFPSTDNLKRLPSVSASNTQKSIGISKFSVALLERFEMNLQSAGITPKNGSTAQALYLLGKPSKNAVRYEESSMVITKASQNLAYTRCGKYGLANDECASFISTLNLRDSDYGKECASLAHFTCKPNKMSSKYRTFDGSCNNPVRSSWGQALTGYKRLLHPKYADGIEQPRRSVRHRELPSARVVSNNLAGNMDRPNDKKTIALAVWSEFVYHDLAHTPVRKTIHTGQAIRCCDNSGLSLTPRYVHPSCLPISVPNNDPFYKNEITCMEYTRSATTYRGDCTFGASEQMNQATHFMDGSHIYGSNSRDAAALREKTGGLLRTSTIGGEEYLPLATDPMENCLVDSKSSICFDSGDIRANVNPWSSSLHVLWVREHNRIARALSTLNPAWNSDKLYHEARRIVVAEMQHITYRYWVPALTGKIFDELHEGYDTGYNSDVNPTITNSFATAVFHFLNSLLDQDVEFVDDKRQSVTSSRLADSYFKPGILLQKGLNKILDGMIKEKSQELDFNYDDDLRNRWLGGLDVLAVDIQRGRDHGLPGYNQYRTLASLSPATTFQDLSDNIPHEMIEKLSKVYQHPNDIDLVVGMLAEEPLPSSLLGATATYLLKEQLWRTRAGDRYFYSHMDEAGSFSKRQLSEIRRASLPRLLCDNAGFVTVQRDVFQPSSDSNPTVSCEEIKKLNFEAWQDPSTQPDIFTRTNKWIKNKVGTGNSTNAK